MNPLISIIIPIYNAEQYLERCLASVVNQAYKNIEIILVNDGSSDDSPLICDKWRLKDTRIKIIHQKNQGVSVARNNGLKICKGNYVSFIDSDDIIDSNFINDAVYIINKENSDFIHFNHQNFKTTSDIQYVKTNELNYKKISNEEAIKTLFIDNKKSVVWGNVYSINLFQNLYFEEDYEYAEDMFIIHKLYSKAKNIIFIDKKSYFYNQTGESLVRSKFNKNKLLVKSATREWAEFCKTYYPALYDLAFAYYLTTVINLCSYLLNKEYINILTEYREIIKRHYRIIKNNPYITKNDKIKSFLLFYNFKSVYNLFLKLAKWRRNYV